MKKENIVVKKNTDEHLAPGGRGWHTMLSKGVLKEENLMSTPSLPLQGTSPKRNCFYNTPLPRFAVLPRKGDRPIGTTATYSRPGGK